MTALLLEALQPPQAPFTAFTSNGIDDNADAVAITIDSSENVGIGTTSPSNKFVVAEGTNQHGIELAPEPLATFKPMTEQQLIMVI